MHDSVGCNLGGVAVRGGGDLLPVILAPSSPPRLHGYEWQSLSLYALFGRSWLGPSRCSASRVSPPHLFNRYHFDLPLFVGWPHGHPFSLPPLEPEAMGSHILLVKLNLSHGRPFELVTKDSVPHARRIDGNPPSLLPWPKSGESECRPTLTSLCRTACRTAGPALLRRECQGFPPEPVVNDIICVLPHRFQEFGGPEGLEALDVPEFQRRVFRLAKERDPILEPQKSTRRHWPS